jgi:hypothetical protein
MASEEAGDDEGAGGMQSARMSREEEGTIYIVYELLVHEALSY